MRWLLLIPLALCSAQMPNSAITAWLNQGLLQGQTTTDVPTTTHFTIVTTKTPTSECTATGGQPGKCVKPQYCKETLPVVDPSTRIIYRDLDCSYQKQCCPLSQILTVPAKTNSLPDACGYSNPGGYSLRITDDDPTGFSDYADFPWMVALLTNSYGNTWSPNDYIGGGALIHPSVVLTVAHKLISRQANEIKCRAGEWDFKIEDEIFIHQDRNVRKIAIHKDFLHLRAHYDVALLFLEAPFDLKGVYHIGVACLAQDMPAPGTLCYSMGWGSSFNNQSYTNLLKKIRLPVIDPDTCQRQLRNTQLGSNFLLHHTLFCAGGELGKDTCVGDGGSPLVCPIQSNNAMKRYAVYGLVAYGVGCGLQDVPGVYAKVPSVIEWINRQMQGEQLSTKSYYM